MQKPETTLVAGYQAWQKNFERHVNKGEKAVSYTHLTQTAIELAPEGTGYRATTRFAKFFNLPELIALFKESADIQTPDMPVSYTHLWVLLVAELHKIKQLRCNSLREKN